MTESIQDIFEHNIKLIGDMEKAVYYFREQQYDKALYLLAHSIDQIKLVIEAIITNREYFNLVDTKSMLEMLTGILDSKKNKDFVLLADLLELQLINFLIGVQELIISKEEIIYDEDTYKENIALLMENGIGFPKEMQEPINTTKLLESGYRVEFTSCGQMTLVAENEGFKFYFHTNSRIQLEAFLLARNWKQKEKKRYLIYGFGMGYHVQELHRLAEEAEIDIYESDCNVMQLACAFTDIKELLLKKQIKLIYDPELKILRERLANMQETEEFFVHYPSYQNIRSSEGKEFLDNKLSWLKAIEAC
ncbi:MAG: hypothetical protein PHF63_02795 [Herbinix sp.]|nr:hypothetical protein [Herbinix sp.]